MLILFGDKIRSQTKPFLYLFQLVGAKDPVHELLITRMWAARSGRARVASSSNSREVRMGYPLSSGRVYLLSMGGFGWRCHLETGVVGGDFFSAGRIGRQPAPRLRLDLIGAFYGWS